MPRPDRSAPRPTRSPEAAAGFLGVVGLDHEWFEFVIGRWLLFLAARRPRTFLGAAGPVEVGVQFEQFAQIAGVALVERAVSARAFEHALVDHVLLR